MLTAVSPSFTPFLQHRFQECGVTDASSYSQNQNLRSENLTFWNVGLDGAFLVTEYDLLLL